MFSEILRLASLAQDDMEMLFVISTEQREWRNLAHRRIESRTLFAVFFSALAFCTRSLHSVAFTGLPKSIEELFGKRSGRRNGQNGKRSAPSAMAPWRDEVGMTGG